VRITDGGCRRWRCNCGNVAESDGFDPCDATADEEVEPNISGDWNSIDIVCRRCGRIIDQNTLTVTGRREE
jgi:hypothetical protein